MPRERDLSAPGAAAGALLGPIAARTLYADFTAFCTGVANGDEVKAFVQFILDCRVEPRNRHRYSTFLCALMRPRIPRWATRALQQAFGVYCVVEPAAKPTAPHPQPLGDLAQTLPREVRRLLARHGVRGDPVLMRQTHRERANIKIAKLWASMSGKQMMVWVDNYYRRRFVANPDVDYQSISCSVLHVLQLPNIPMCPPMPTYHQLQFRRSHLTAQLLRAGRLLREYVDDLAQGELQHQDVRVPLDCNRYGVRSLQWCPFMLTDLQVGNQVDMLRLFNLVLSTVLPHCLSPVPVLVDLNIYYRFMKMCYGKGYKWWAIKENFRYVPPLFGVWHSFKYAVQSVHRSFHSQYVYLNKGTVAVGSRHPTHPKLRTMEMLMAAIITVPKELRDGLRDLVRDRETKHKDALNDHAVYKKFTARWRRVCTLAQKAEYQGKDRDYEAKIRAAHHALRHAQAMDRLVNQYALALLVIGNLVRDCNWAGRDPGTARYGRLAMEYAAMVMLNLYGDRAVTGSAAHVAALARGLIRLHVH